MREFRDRLKLARERRGFRRPIDAIRRFNWTQTTYYEHENGRRAPERESVRDYAKQYRVSIDWLLNGEGDEPQEVASYIDEAKLTLALQEAFSALGETQPARLADAIIEEASRPAPLTGVALTTFLGRIVQARQARPSGAPANALSGQAHETGPDSPDTFRMLGSVVEPLFQQDSQDAEARGAKRQGKNAPPPRASVEDHKSAAKPKPRSGARTQT